MCVNAAHCGKLPMEREDSFKKQKYRQAPSKPIPISNGSYLKDASAARRGSKSAMQISGLSKGMTLKN